jgi:uncharacterized protein YjbI with pentapeptide repeats
MANESQLAIIKQGVKAWDNWRAENPQEFIDLNDADLSDIELSGCNLAGAWLNRVNLSGTNLNDANLSGARIENSNLKKADFINADLKGCYLRESFLLQINLSGANLSGAVITDADLRSSNLSGADFTSADLSGAHLGAANLKGAQFVDAYLKKANLVQVYGDETNFQKANLTDVLICKAVLKKANFSDAQLSNIDFSSADLTEARFNNADLFQSKFSYSILTGADFTEAYLVEANLNLADMDGAILSGANLQKAVMVQTNFENANLASAYIYGISAWDIKGTPKDQSNLVISQDNNYLLFKDADSDKEKIGTITIDDLQVAQFIYLLLNRKILRNVIDTITSKAVLILGRFTSERKMILDAMADELRKNNLLPIIFDFEKPTDRDFTETIKTLAGISLFIIADITSPKSSPLELQAIVPDYQIPLVPIIQAGEQPFSMLSDLIGKHDWVLPRVLKYNSVEELTSMFKIAVIDRAWQKHQELQKKKSMVIETLSIEDFVQKSVT